MITETDLSKKMRVLAKSRDPIECERLQKLADDFDAATDTMTRDATDENTKKMLGAWARARRAYCEMTGEDLL